MFTFFDLETTDKKPESEMLTGFFITVDRDFKKIDSLYVESKPELYLQDSFNTHKISYKQAMKFPDKKWSFIKIAKYLKKYKDGFFICHANGDMFGVKGYFDWQVLNMVALGFGHEIYYRFQNVFHNQKVISTHTIAKKLIKSEKYNLEFLAKKFNIPHNPHEAVSDTLATMKLFQVLLKDYNNLSDKELFDLGHWSGEIDFNKKTDGFV